MNLFSPICLGLCLFSLVAQAAPLTLSDQDKACFADTLLTRLKPATDAKSADSIENPVLRQAAREILAGTWRTEERKRVCRAYEPVDALAKRLKTSPYSQFENPTGIYFSAGEDAIIVVEGLGDQTTTLRIRDFGPKQADQSYPLRNGLNTIRSSASGLAYVSYYTPDFKTAPKRTVSILGGKVNGVFDATRQNKADWKKTIANTCTDVIDLIGERVQLIYSVKELRDHCADGKRMVEITDSIIRDQHLVMGLDRYHRVPDNHILGRVIWQGYMHADGLGAAFHHDTLKDLANPEIMHRHAWGIAHEFGHVNQTRPGMKWVSTTEVTNNIFSCVSNQRLNPTDMRLEHEQINGGDGNVAGGRFNAFLNSALIRKEQWLCQRGPDKMKGYENGGDHFVKLVPLWQLQLFFNLAGHGNPDFYAEIFEKVRNTDESGMSNGQLQLNFMRNVCDAVKLDLSRFFQQTGMLVPIDKDMDDYSRAQLTITDAQCAELVKYASRYPKPDSPVIFYISTNSLDAFRNRLPVTGTTGNGIKAEGNNRIISHTEWKNVAAFETYQEKQLVRIAMAGTGTTDNSSTTVPFPPGSTRIEAVSWDGKRTLVLGTR